MYGVLRKCAGITYGVRSMYLVFIGLEQVKRRTAPRPYGKQQSFGRRWRIQSRPRLPGSETPLEILTRQVLLTRKPAHSSPLSPTLRSQIPVWVTRVRTSARSLCYRAGIGWNQSAPPRVPLRWYRAFLATPRIRCCWRASTWAVDVRACFHHVSLTISKPTRRPVRLVALSPADPAVLPRLNWRPHWRGLVTRLKTG